MKEVHPVIISASRRTDIPAFYFDKFLSELKKGYTLWKNPFNPKQVKKVFFDNTKLIVFWSKYPVMYLKYRREIKIEHYFLYTLNYYPEIEVNLPEFEKRVNLFEKLSSILGKERVVWRFDPIVLIEGLITSEDIIERFKIIADKIHKYTKRVIISFMTPYKKSTMRLKRFGFIYKEPNIEEVRYIAGSLSKVAKSYGLEIQSCSERLNALGELERCGIKNGACIDKEYILNVFKDSKNIVKYVKMLLKDKGQRRLCRCIESTDIGEYGTCKFNCLYCYAI